MFLMLLLGLNIILATATNKEMEVGAMQDSMGIRVDNVKVEDWDFAEQEVGYAPCDGLSCTACMRVPGGKCSFADGVCWNAQLIPAGTRNFARTVEGCRADSVEAEDWDFAEQEVGHVAAEAEVGEFSDADCFSYKYYLDCQQMGCVWDEPSKPMGYHCHYAAAASENRDAGTGLQTHEAEALAYTAQGSRREVHDLSLVHLLAAFGFAATVYGAFRYYVK